MEQKNSLSDTNNIVNILYKLAVKYPELSIIISAMLLLLLPLAVVSQIAEGRVLVYFAMFFIFSVVAIAILYMAKGFVSAITHSPVLRTVSSWCVGLTVLSITVSLGISVSALLLSQIFPKLEGGLFSKMSQFAVSVLVEKDTSTLTPELSDTVIPNDSKRKDENKN